MNTKYKTAMYEILEYLKHIDEDSREKIDKNFIKFLKENAIKKEENENNVDYTKPLEEIEFSYEAKIIFSYICYRYWCENDDDKKKLKKVLDENNAKHNKELAEKYSYEKLFNRTEKQIPAELSLTVIQEESNKNIFSKFISFIKKKIFKK